MTVTVVVVVIFAALLNISTTPTLTRNRPTVFRCRRPEATDTIVHLTRATEGTEISFVQVLVLADKGS
jgi:hypothetical protein